MTQFYYHIRKHLPLIFIGAILFSFPLSALSQVRIMVKTEAGGGIAFATSTSHNTWETATFDLQAAIDTAAFYNGGEIWVAGGTYLPTVCHNPFIDGTIPPFEERCRSFIPANGVTVIGGFSGTESTLEERPSDLFEEGNATILSGDIGVENDDSDNSYHVVFFPLGTDNTAVLKDLIITHGNSTASNTDYLPYSRRGGGLHIHEGGMIENCHIRQNTAEVDGGGAYLFKGGLIKGCQIYNNTANNNGGGVMLNLGGEVQYSVIYNNNAGQETPTLQGKGGGIFIESSTDLVGRIHHSVIVGNASVNKAGGVGFLNGGISANNLITNNIAGGNGGGIHIQGNGLVVNNTIVANQSDGGAGLFADQGGEIINTVIWGNQTPYESNLQFDRIDETTLVKYSAIENFLAAPGITNLITLESTNEGSGNHPHFVNPIDFIGLPQAVELEQALNADYHVGLNSALLDAGMPDVTGLPFFTTDLDGDSRIIKELVEIGAYETLYYTVSSSVVGDMGGIIEPSGLTRLLPGASHLFTLTPLTNYQVVSFALNGVEYKTELTPQDNTLLFTLAGLSEDIQALAEFAISSGIRPMEKTAIRLFPNPATDWIQIQGGEPIESAIIYSVSGILLKTLNADQVKQPISIASLPKGIYFVRVNGETGASSLYKFFKN